jgi:hypothetical protein
MPAIYAVLGGLGDIAAGAMLLDLALDALQGVVSGVAAADQTLFNISAPNLTALVSADVLNRYTASGPTYRVNRELGLLHFGLAAASASLLGGPEVAGGDPTQATITQNSAGAAYAGGARCLTDACIAATINSYAAQSVAANAALVAPRGPAVPLNITPLALLNLVWLFPGAVVLLAALSACAPSLCRRCCAPAAAPRWEKCLFGWTAGCILCQAP